MMKELLEGLIAVSGGPGQEASIAAAIRAQVQTIADEVYTDVLGNLYAVLHASHGKESAAGEGDGKTVMLVAPMDEPALLVTDIGEKGFLRVEPLGQLEARALIGARVRVGRTGRLGVVGVSEKVKLDDVEFAHLFVDIGVADADAAQQHVRVGDTATFAYHLEAQSEEVLIGHALASRAPCAVLIRTLMQVQTRATVIAVFTAQSLVGSRGARVAAYRIAPDLAVAVNASPASDTPDALPGSLRLGGGVAIKALDGGMVVAPGLRDGLLASARAVEVTTQIEVSPRARSEAGAVFLTKTGVPTCGLAVPMRHAGTLSQMVDVRDLDGAVAVLTAYLRDL